VGRRNDFLGNAFTTHPYLGALLFDNENSEARDHAAAERSMSSTGSSLLLQGPDSANRLNAQYTLTHVENV
jgi:hypothetical protein